MSLGLLLYTRIYGNRSPKSAIKNPNHFCPQSGFRFHFLPVGLIPSIICPKNNPFVYVVVQQLKNIRQNHDIRLKEAR